MEILTNIARLEMTIRFLTKFAQLETSVCSQNRPAGNTAPPRIGSIAYGSTRLIELMTNLSLPPSVHGVRPPQKCKKLSKIAVNYTTKVSQNDEISDGAQEADTSLYR